MSWGRTPTNEGVTVSRRRTPSAPVELKFSRIPLITPDADSCTRFFGGSAFVTFEHRDGRIWESRTLPILKSNPLYGDVYDLITRITTEGVEPVRLLSTTLQSAKSSVARFANMPLDKYGVLISDATSTLSNPVAGRQVKVKMTDEESGTSRTRYGRVDGALLVLFPSQLEINVVLEMVIDEDSEVLEHYIEDHDLVDVGTVNNWRGRPQQDARPIQLEIPTTTSRRQYGAVTAILDQMCDDDGRELRAIQL